MPTHKNPDSPKLSATKHGGCSTRSPLNFLITFSQNSWKPFVNRSKEFIANFVRPLKELTDSDLPLYELLINSLFISRPV